MFEALKISPMGVPASEIKCLLGKVVIGPAFEADTEQMSTKTSLQEELGRFRSLLCARTDYSHNTNRESTVNALDILQRIRIPSCD